MKLLKRPDMKIEEIEISTFGICLPQRVRGQISIGDVEIVVPDKILDTEVEDEVWRKLKYGVDLDLGDAFFKNLKIEKIEFPSEGIILYGVRPFEMDRTAVWKGRVFKCKIDHYEVIS